MAVNTKLDKLKKTADPTHAVWDAIIFKKTKAIFGGRCHTMVTGSAPISPEILNFMKIT